VTSGTSTKRKHYHHGRLRDALIEAGLAIVEEEGIDAVSLRAVARRAKVSHSAPYHHFVSKAELLAALAAAGFDRLVVAIEANTAQVSPAEPILALRAIGRSYMHFAAANPSVFRLMFRPELTKPSEHGLLQAAEARAFGTLIETIVRCQAVGQLPEADPLKLAAYAWSGVHGMSTLRVEQLLNETPLGKYDWNDLVETVNELIIAGMMRRNT
jgi:AcrR family transcriptional regulator